MFTITSKIKTFSNIILFKINTAFIFQDQEQD